MQKKGRCLEGYPTCRIKKSGDLIAIRIVGKCPDKAFCQVIITTYLPRLQQILIFRKRHFLEMCGNSVQPGLGYGNVWNVLFYEADQLFFFHQHNIDFKCGFCERLWWVCYALSQFWCLSVN